MTTPRARFRQTVTFTLLLGASLVALSLFGPRGARAQFPQQVITAGSASAARSVFAADLDGDGDEDVLSASSDDDKIAWYENNGDGTFDQNVITTGASGAADVFAADLTGNGNPDVLSASGSRIAWYENQGGTFSDQKVITTEAEEAQSVFAADLTGNGNYDVLSTSTRDDGIDKIAWYENTGGGSFSGENVITTEAGAADIFAADLNGDGTVDILSASFVFDEIAWYENNGDDTFSSQKVITTDADGATSVFAADVDGDGDADALSAHDGAIAWYENRLGESGADEDGFGTLQDITSFFSAHSSVFAANVDGDGDADILSADGGEDEILWYENQGDGSFSDRKVITSNASNAEDVFAADLNDDDSVDVLSASPADDKIAWYENEVGESGADEDGFGAQQILTSGAVGAQSVFTADVDGDGDVDAFSASSDHEVDAKIAWYENEVGDGGADSDGFGTQQIITTDLDGVQSVHAADIDGDGDADALSASDVKIAWYENQVGENGADEDGFGAEQVITFEVSEAWSVFAADVDGDGDADVLSASRDDGKIAWYENQVGENGADEDGFGDQQVITTLIEPESVHAADVDGDGDPDALSASGDEITWYENQVGESGADEDGFGAQQVITTEAPGAKSVYAADVDGDGDADVLSASSRDNKIAWYENREGESGADEDGFGSQQVITTGAVGAASVHAADVDGDGDADALSASEGDILGSGSKIAWYENQVGESGADEDGFGNQETITTRVKKAKAVYAADVDGDDDADPFSASFDDDKIAWYRNDLASILAQQSDTVDAGGKVDFGDTGVDVNFSGVDGSGEVTVTKFDVGPTNTEGISESNVSTYRFKIDAGNDLEFDSDTELRLDVSTLGGVGTPANVVIYKRSAEGSGTFTQLSSSYDSGANDLVATTDEFSEFVLASSSSDNPLPVELARFEAQVNDQKVRLTWRTASEQNNAGFRIQRKGEGAERREAAWTTVGQVEGAGTTTEPQSYRFTDEDLPYEADRLTYRLRQVDTDGAVHFSEEITVRRGVQRVQLEAPYPNPARGPITVRYALPDKQEVTLRLYDVLGRQVRTVVRGKRAGRHEQSLDLRGLSSGVYFLRLSAGGETRSQRLTVVR